MWWSVIAGCQTDPAPPEAGYRPDVVACPGGPSCPDATGPLEAGAGRASIVPACFETWTDTDVNAEYSPSTDSFADCGCNRVCGDGDAGDGDGVFQASWIAGFGSGRAATGVREGDGLWARALVLRQGSTAVGIVVLDLVGWFYDDALATRARVAEDLPELDHLVVLSTHVHQGPDTMGLWGPYIGASGVDPAYLAQVREAVAVAVGEAWTNAEPAELALGSVEVDAANLISDTRDPGVVDSRLNVAAFTATDDGAMLATLVNFGNHPETRGSDNTLFTSDFVHALRETVEGGVDWGNGSPQAGVGGTTLYLNAAVGGMMTSLHAPVVDPNGTQWPDSSWEKTDAEGKILGGYALEALAAATPAPGGLKVGAQSLRLPVVNRGLQAMQLMGVITRATYDWDASKPITDENQPTIASEVDVLQIGPLQILGVPGELLPEVLVGYDGATLDPENPNPPDLSLAPPPPYWRDLATSEPFWVMGLANDEIGYLIPPFEFELHPSAPYIFEAEGDHYEETNSLGPDTVPLLTEAIAPLISWVSP